jgi:ribulose-phosphate 3-epimerase
MIEILPSLLSADFARLDQEITRVEAAGVRMLHLDVMDGHFVPEISIGPPVVRSIRTATDLHLDVHLMVSNPEQQVESFIKAGANSISVQVEACTHLHRVLRVIQAHGLKAGAVINPSTPVAALDAVLDVVDYVLVMSVDPGFGGQTFIPRSLDKVMQLDRRRKEAGLQFAIEIDGGVTAKNVAAVVQAGCDWVVAGSAIFGNEDPSMAVLEMQKLARDATDIRI